MAERAIFLRPVNPLKSRPARIRWLPLLLSLVILALWYLGTRQTEVSFMIASPGAVLSEFIKMLESGALFRHLMTTLGQVIIGFGIGVGAAFVLGYGIARNRVLEGLLGPYAVGFQAVPIVAIAPVLIRIFGPGLATNSLICSLIVFFPMLMSTIVGMRGIDPDLRDLMRTLRATPWQVFTRLEVPGALPSLFGGLKISTTLAIAAAVVAEGFSPSAGLGFLIYSSRYVYNTAGVFVGIIALTSLALILYEIVARLERRFLAWRNA